MDLGPWASRIADPEPGPPHPERVWVRLPLSVEALVALSEGLCRHWPDAAAIAAPSDWLIVELRGDYVEHPGYYTAKPEEPNADKDH